MRRNELLRLCDLLGKFIDEHPDDLDLDGRDKDVLSSVRHQILDYVEGPA